jgi:predicted Fe-Mo cluster-binding NifX family protein
MRKNILLKVLLLDLLKNKEIQMIIAISSINRGLSENVSNTFSHCPGFILYDNETQKSEYIYNHCRCSTEQYGPQIAQILINRKTAFIITGEIDEASLRILYAASINVYVGYPGSVENALNDFEKEMLHPIVSNVIDSSNIVNDHISTNLTIPYFDFFNGHLILDGKNILYSDWDFKLSLDACEKAPKNWIYPTNFRNGIYHLRLEILKMKKTDYPIEFEISWRNLPEDEQSNIPHFCSFGPYTSFSNIGIYEHIAKIDDMEKTSLDGSIESWNWESAWDAPFVLIKPYGQDPFPIEFRFYVSIVK